MTRPNIVFPETGADKIVELRNITQVYPTPTGSVTVIEGLNFLVEDKPGRGQFVILLGLSGCGKSTVLRYISGQQSPTSGEVLLLGSPHPGPGSVSVVSQQYSSLPWYTVYDNVALPLRIRSVEEAEIAKRVNQILSEVGLTDHSHKFAQYPLLSGGQLQRVAIARSLIHEPEIVLMDEPFGALDVVTRRKMQMMLLEIWERRQFTVIFITHDAAEAVLLGDEIYVMSPHPGRITDEVNTLHSLPFHRDRDTLRDPKFTRLTHEVYDVLENSVPDVENGILETQE